MPRLCGLRTLRISQIKQVQRRAACWTVSNFDRQVSIFKIVQDLGWRSLGQKGLMPVYACAQGSTDGIPISFKALPMIPLVIPLAPLVSQLAYHWENPKRSLCLFCKRIHDLNAVYTVR